ncbi:acid-soluble spore protein N [Cytobacillus depressus]|uniref:Small, acid-soluble spore protein N n=1 Tax=Cytobacillus depressus TaxID=1602942 RepID=A0A6L3V1A3_9BACI|nr:acid-soluble spore protein N [Cytobacillus depressus]KAB2329747.1 acid-soluble spore protein N [Cytobacillus depressus]
MSNPKGHPGNYNPNHIGTQPRSFGGNKGKKMQSNTGGTPQVIQTKGE